MEGKIQWFTATMRHNLDVLKGVKVSKEHGDARKAICDTCENKQKRVFSDVCSLCNCPLSIKPYFLNHILSAVNLSVERDENDRTRVICPHPKGNKWEEIDKVFLEN